MSGDTVGCHAVWRNGGRTLSPSSGGWRPGMPLNIHSPQSNPATAKHDPGPGVSHPKAEKCRSVALRMNKQGFMQYLHTPHQFASGRPDTGTYDFIDVKFTDSIRHRFLCRGGGRFWGLLCSVPCSKHQLPGSAHFVTVHRVLRLGIVCFDF